jgi:hypothetical protein
MQVGSDGHGCTFLWRNGNNRGNRWVDRTAFGAWRGKCRSCAETGEPVSDRVRRDLTAEISSEPASPVLASCHTRVSRLPRTGVHDQRRLDAVEPAVSFFGQTQFAHVAMEQSNVQFLFQLHHRMVCSLWRGALIGRGLSQTSQRGGPDDYRDRANFAHPRAIGFANKS